MDFKTWWYDAKSTKWQILIGTLLITIIFIGCFTYLETYQFEDWKYSAFIKSMIGILMGTVALGVITGIIIIFQSLVAMDREKNQKIFDERLQLYKEFSKQTMGFISDDILEIEEREKLKVIEKEILMIASSETYEAWSDLYLEIKKLPSSKNEKEELIKTNDNKPSDELEELVLDISDKSFDFVNSCRMDLEIGAISKDIVKASKAENRKEIRKTKKFTVNDFKNYDDWLAQRIQNEKKNAITKEQQKIHKSIYDYVNSEFSNQISLNYRFHTVAVRVDGKKFLNISLRPESGGYGVSLYLLRSDIHNYHYPEISDFGGGFKPARNSKRGCEYYQIVQIKNFTNEIEQQIKLSFKMRKDKKALLKESHPNIDSILKTGTS